MNNLFRKLAEWIGMLKEEDEDQKLLTHEKHETTQNVIQEVEVRTKTVYPRNQNGASFRFPIIPDERPVRREAVPAKDKGNSPRIQHQTKKDQGQDNRLQERRPQERRPQERKEPIAESIKRKSFTPSQVVSPVYGKASHRPDQNQSTPANGIRLFETEKPLQPKQEQKESLSRSDEMESKTAVFIPETKTEEVQKSVEYTELEQQEQLEQQQTARIISFPLRRSSIQMESAEDNNDSTQLSATVERPKEQVPNPWISMDKVRSSLISTSPSAVSSVGSPVRSSEESQSSTGSSINPSVGSSTNPSTGASINPVGSSTNPSTGASINPVGSSTNSSTGASINPSVGSTTNSSAGSSQNTSVGSSLNSSAVPANSPAAVETVSARLASSTTDWAKENYDLPSLDDLKPEPLFQSNDDSFIHEQIDKLTVALENFNVMAEVVGVVKGPTVTRYELQPAPGVKVNKFTNLIDDIKLALAAKDIRMEAPIPGRSAIGIEVPNEVSSPVFIRSILASEEFRSHPSPLAVALGKDISGEPVIGDLKRMPHGLIAGATGSGKSVCINSILISLMYKATPSEVRLILIDPKVVELAPYNHIPHLLTPVVTDPKQATAALKWAVEEMDSRYEKFAELGTRDIERYNAVALQEGFEKLPYILIVIDELADLMMVAPHDVEESICRIAQKARACGIHLLVATQRPSVDVITGLIKANIPTRVAFAVSSQADSRTILDMGGAERLLGKGDMLYYPSGLAKPLRLQGNFVSDEEIETVVEHVKSQQKVRYLFDKEELTRSAQQSTENEDELFTDALLFVIEQGQASSSSLQRRFRIGYNRAARLIDMMESEGFISGQSGSKPRDVLISMEEYECMFS